VLGLDCFPSPGHASHHVCYVDAGGTLYAGDAAGVRIQPSGHILPVSPPPDVDVEGWRRTLDEISSRAPERLALIHFGLFDDVEYHVEQTRRELDTWVERVRSGVSEEEFVEAARRDLLDASDWDAPYYERAAPFWQSYAGLKRWAAKHK
jgi:glyoxylase-like metal-dependent hydrolase (beta-lactamase superfamily II)